jgi:hypothetical protein
MNERLLRPAETEIFVRNMFKRPFSVAYQAKLRSIGGGPRFVRSGRYIAYQESELIAHFGRQLTRQLDSTSSIATPASSSDILDLEDRDLDDEGPYSWMFTGDREFDRVTNESFPDFDPDLEMERAQRRWQFAELT